MHASNDASQLDAALQALCKVPAAPLVPDPEMLTEERTVAPPSFGTIAEASPGLSPWAMIQLILFGLVVLLRLASC